MTELAAPWSSQWEGDASCVSYGGNIKDWQSCRVQSSAGQKLGAQGNGLQAVIVDSNVIHCFVTSVEG